jgi:bacterioferritin
MESENERTQTLKKFRKYRKSLKASEAELIEKLQNFHKSKDDRVKTLKNSENDLKPLNPDDAGEIYIISQLNVARAMPKVLDQHINLLEEGEDLDRVLVSFEYNVYRVKKDVYADMGDWELLLKVLPDDRRFHIQKDPKGPGDLILKELIWIKDYEKGLKDMGFERI